MAREKKIKIIQELVDNSSNNVTRAGLEGVLENAYEYTINKEYQTSRELEIAKYQKLRKCINCKEDYTDAKSVGHLNCHYHPDGVHLGKQLCCFKPKGSIGCTRSDHDDDHKTGPRIKQVPMFIVTEQIWKPELEMNVKQSKPVFIGNPTERVLDFDKTYYLVKTNE